MMGGRYVTYFLSFITLGPCNCICLRYQNKKDSERIDSDRSCYWCIVFTGRNSHKTFRSVILILFRNASPDGNGGYQVVDGDPFISWLCEQLFYCSNSGAVTDPLCNLEKPIHHKGYFCFFSILSLHEKEWEY